MSATMTGRRTRAATERSFILDGRAENPVYHRLGEGQFDRALAKLAWWTKCGKPIGSSIFHVACLPRWRSEQIARPCKRCYPETSA